MNQDSLTARQATFQQTYLFEADTGLLCRILGLYAARAIHVLHVNFTPLDEQTMQLTVQVRLAPGDDADSLRVLLAKALNFIGVFEACEHEHEHVHGVPQAA